MNNDTTLPARRIPVILDPDIGDDMHDTWALAWDDFSAFADDLTTRLLGASASCELNNGGAS